MIKGLSIEIITLLTDPWKYTITVKADGRIIERFLSPYYRVIRDRNKRCDYYGSLPQVMSVVANEIPKIPVLREVWYD